MTDSSYTKWQISIFSAVIFILVVNPYTYILTQKLLGGILGQIAEPNGCQQNPYEDLDWYSSVPP